MPISPQQASDPPEPTPACDLRSWHYYLHALGAAHIEPVAPSGLRHADEHGVAARAAHHRSHRAGVDHQRSDRAAHLAAHADDLRPRDLKGKELAQHAARSITIQS